MHFSLSGPLSTSNLGKAYSGEGYVSFRPDTGLLKGENPGGESPGQPQGDESQELPGALEPVNNTEMQVWDQQMCWFKNWNQKPRFETFRTTF